MNQSVNATSSSLNGHLNQQSKQVADDLIQWLRSYARSRIDSRLIDERRCIPPHIVLDFGNRGLLAMLVDKAFGGLGLSHRDSKRVIEQLTAIDLTLGIFVGLNNTLGVRPIARFGSNELKTDLLPELARGRGLGAFALTEEGAGSNPRAIVSTAQLSTTGEWVLAGKKVWSGSSAWASVVTVFVRMMQTDGAPGRMTAFALRQGRHDIRLGPEALTMGVRGMVQNSIILDGTKVTEKDLVGEVGQGWDVAEDSMMYARLGLGAISVGGMKRCFQLMHRYALHRSISTGKLLNNAITLTRLSEVANATLALDTLLNQLAEMLDAGEVVAGEAFVACKVAGSEFLWRAADWLVQMLGGRGYIESNLAPQLFRDARLLRIFEGPTETLTAFLGSNVLNDFASMQRFLERISGGTAIGNELGALADTLKRRRGGEMLDRGSTIRQSQIAAFVLGEIAIAAIICAAVARDDPSAPERTLDKCRTWARTRLDVAIASAPARLRQLADCHTAGEISSIADAFASSIGCEEQAGIGYESSIDPLLLPDATQV